MRKILPVILILCGINVYGQQSATFTDPRDNQVYKTIILGGKVWMGQNLNYKSDNSWWYNNDSMNGLKMGRLYKWDVAQNACPAGWHLPSVSEWDTLIDAMGGKETAGGKLSIYGTSAFRAPFAGKRTADGTYSYKGNFGFYWTSTATNAGDAKAYSINAGFQTINLADYYKSSAFSIRCTKD